MVLETGHSNTAEASQSYLYKKKMMPYFFLVNWVSVRILKKVCDCEH